MPCPRHEELSAYADQMMKPGERARFQKHLNVCPICQQQLEDLQALRQTLHALPSPTLGFDLASQMVRVFDPVPPGGLCAAAELCRLSKGRP